MSPYQLSLLLCTVGNKIGFNGPFIVKLHRESKNIKYV